MNGIVSLAIKQRDNIIAIDGVGKIVPRCEKGAQVMVINAMLVGGESFAHVQRRAVYVEMIAACTQATRLDGNQGRARVVSPFRFVLSTLSLTTAGKSSQGRRHAKGNVFGSSRVQLTTIVV